MSVQDISNNKNYLQNSEKGVVVVGGGGLWAVIQTLRKGGDGFPKTSGLSLF